MEGIWWKGNPGSKVNSCIVLYFWEVIFAPSKIELVMPHIQEDKLSLQSYVEENGIINNRWTHLLHILKSLKISFSTWLKIHNLGPCLIRGILLKQWGSSFRLFKSKAIYFKFHWVAKYPKSVGFAWPLETLSYCQNDRLHGGLGSHRPLTLFSGYFCRNLIA